MTIDMNSASIIIGNPHHQFLLKSVLQILIETFNKPIMVRVIPIAGKIWFSNIILNSCMMVNYYCFKSTKQNWILSSSKAFLLLNHTHGYIDFLYVDTAS